MSKDITQQNQKNLWGRQVDGSASLTMEPQRVDLFLVDLSQAARQIQDVANTNLPPQYPQFVRSISMPDMKVRAEPYRRNSIPYNMPSWDDPPEAVKVCFLLDTYDDSNKSSICDLLDVWVALTRAGRGSRNGGYANASGHFLLDATYKVKCQFDIYVSLLRGTMPSNTAASDAATLNRINAQNYDQYLAAQKTFAEMGAVDAPPGPPIPVKIPELATSDMKEHTKWVLKNAWCAGYKLTDLSYLECQLVSVDATFYPETIERESIGVTITGSPKAQSGNPTKTNP